MVDTLGLMAHPREAITKSKSLKKDGNRCFRKKDFKGAISIYGKSLHFLCVSSPSSQDEANLMTDLGISLNLNLVAC